MTAELERRLEAAIPVGHRILLDTTCLAAYLDRTEAVHPVACQILDAFVASGRNEAIISMVTLMEILVRPMRSEPPTDATVVAFVRRHPNLAAVPLDLSAAREAAALRARYRMRPPDALIVGTAIAYEVGIVVTNDHAWSSRLAAVASRLSVVTLSEIAAIHDHGA